MDWNALLTDMWTFIKDWYGVPLTLLYVAVGISILMNNGNPSKTIAWLLVIAFLPVVGSVIYFFFGQPFNKEKNFSRISKKESEFVRQKWVDIEKETEQNLRLLKDKIGPLSSVFRYLNISEVSPFFTGNKVKLLTNGEEKFLKFLEALRRAKHHIHLEYYIFDEDEIGRKVLEILMEKAMSGVRVRVMADDVGSPQINKNRQKYIDVGIQFQTFLPVRFSSLANSNYRNHRKLLIVDGRMAFLGGINISDKYINSLATPPIKNKIYWRDTSVLIEGSAVNLLQVHFYLHWLMTRGDSFNINEAAYYYPRNIEGKTGFGAGVSFGFTTPGQRVASAMESMILGIMQARRKVQLCTPYFIPTPEFKSALLIAASAGVEVEMIIPAKSDSLIVQKASMSFLQPLIQRGVKVYLYDKGFMHAKTIAIDGKVAYIGTVNLDSRSFYINFEVTAVISDYDLLQEMSDHFEIDRSDSTLFTAQMWKSRPWYSRAFASVCRLLAPIL